MGAVPPCCRMVVIVLGCGPTGPICRIKGNELGCLNKRNEGCLIVNVAIGFHHQWRNLWITERQYTDLVNKRTVGLCAFGVPARIVSRRTVTNGYIEANIETVHRVPG